MKGLEDMAVGILVKATGMTPQQLQAMATTTNGAIVEAVELLREIKEGLAGLDKRMEALENVGRE